MRKGDSPPSAGSDEGEASAAVVLTAAARAISKKCQRLRGVGIVTLVGR
jgi:hypothetical protein